MWGVTESSTKDLKHAENSRNVDTVNKECLFTVSRCNFADARLVALGIQDEIPITFENVEIHSPKEYHSLIRALLRKHEHLWYI